MIQKEYDERSRNAQSAKPKLDDVVGGIELTPQDLEAVAGGVEAATIHCTDNLPTLCPCAATIPDSTCSAI